MNRKLEEKLLAVLELATQKFLIENEKDKQREAERAIVRALEKELEAQERRIRQRENDLRERELTCREADMDLREARRKAEEADRKEERRKTLNALSTGLGGSGESF